VKPRLLDLFCCAGGAAVGYTRAGFQVIGVDINPQPRYPYAFIEGDVMTVLADLDWTLFDAVHASPPCQGYSTKTPDRSKHQRLIGPVRELLEATGLPYVIENVDGAKADMIDPQRLCGSSFGLDVRRHRWFETNWPLTVPPCNHAWQTPRFDVYDHGKRYRACTVPVFGTGGGKAREHWSAAMGVDWMTDAELAEAIPPAYTEYIGRQFTAYLRARQAVNA
jgi:DNA (cytosine-5)-methyltransferase 1